MTPIPVFIDGDVGTTGLSARRLLLETPGVRCLTAPLSDRKNPDVKRKLLQESEVALLCLPDDAAAETCALIDELENPPRILDASTGRRTAEGWVYGFAEMDKDQTRRIASADRVANPGCYATGAIALLRPLIAADALASDAPIAMNAISGYTGGGKNMIAAYEAGDAPEFTLYALSLAHKHLPEIQRYALLKAPPLLVPAVGRFPQGMLVCLPLSRAALGNRTREDVAAILKAHYEGRRYVKIFAQPEKMILAPDAFLNSDVLEIHLFGEQEANHLLLVARLDNLGKGAAGAAVQNLKIMLGLL